MYLVESSRISKLNQTKQILGDPSTSLFYWTNSLSPVANYGFSDIKYINDLREAFLKELENFFVDYHELTRSEA